jgi:hypothetical protein|tara:strand:+ start:390 stop:641 length:252 start_codon:yes stop_codon:yes gene_type:complete
MCFKNCISPEYCPDDNVTYPCMECDYCVEEPNSNYEMFYDELINEYLHNVERLKEKFTVKEFNHNHGKHNVALPPEDYDYLPF